MTLDKRFETPSPHAMDAHFQPIVALTNRQVVGFETLARWTDRDLGWCPLRLHPDRRGTRYHRPAVAAVLRKATESARNWPSDLFLSFNLSPSQLVDQNTGLHILAILDRTGFDPRRLEIEITETGLMTVRSQPKRSLAICAASAFASRLTISAPASPALAGCASSFRQAEDRPRLCRIDPRRPPLRAHHQGDTGDVRRPGLDVVAEGIEDEAQAERLIQFGCTGGQGYLFGKPVDADATLLYLREALRGPARAASQLKHEFQPELTGDRRLSADSLPRTSPLTVVDFDTLRLNPVNSAAEKSASSKSNSTVSRLAVLV